MNDARPYFAGGSARRRFPSRAAFENWIYLAAVDQLALQARKRHLPTRLARVVWDREVDARPRGATRIRARWRDLGTVYEQFLKQEYAYSLIPWSTLRTAIDVGANIGDFSTWLAARSDCAIFAVEPGRSAFRLLETNARRLSPRVRTLNVAVGAEAGTTRFYERHFSSLNSIAAAHVLDEPVQAVYDVPVVPLAEVIRRSGFATVDLLKIDVEGAEHDIFRNLPEGALRNVESVLVELHDVAGRDETVLAARLEAEGMTLWMARAEKTAILIGLRDLPSEEAEAESHAPQQQA